MVKADEDKCGLLLHEYGAVTWLLPSTHTYKAGMRPSAMPLPLLSLAVGAPTVARPRISWPITVGPHLRGATTLRHKLRESQTSLEM
jgi:hypothetical protein